MPKSSVPSLHQIPLNQMERGLALPVATLRFEPAEITNRLGFKFETARDDLDELEAVAFSGPSGNQFALVRHRHQPNPGTDILVNEKLVDLSAALRDALKALRFEPRELRWMHPAIKISELDPEPGVPD
jgi:hypothetical protein